LNYAQAWTSKGLLSEPSWMLPRCLRTITWIQPMIFRLWYGCISLADGYHRLIPAAYLTYVPHICPIHPLSTPGVERFFHLVRTALPRKNTLSPPSHWHSTVPPRSLHWYPTTTPLSLLLLRFVLEGLDSQKGARTA